MDLVEGKDVGSEDRPREDDEETDEQGRDRSASFHLLILGSPAKRVNPRAPRVA
jgi:hypothetical protein